MQMDAKIENAKLGRLDMLVLTGLSNDKAPRELARELSYSETTINAIAQCAAKKLHCRSVTAAVAKAIRTGLL